MTRMSVSALERRSPTVVVTIGVLLIALLVFVWAGRDQGLGPLDLETANRLAFALWLAAPIAGGLAGRGSDDRALIRAAIGVGFVVGLGAALVPASGTGDYTCWLSLPAVPLGYVLGRIAVGSILGFGMALSLVAAGRSTRTRSAIVPGIAFAAAINLAASVAAFELFYGGLRCLQ